jgi:dihydroorotase
MVTCSIILVSGSDSAPHPTIAKLGGEGEVKKPAAGVFTQSFATQYVILALEEAIQRGTIKEEDVTQEQLENFLSRFGRQFYKLPETKNRIILERTGERIPESIKSEDGSVEVTLSRGGADVFSLRWSE